MEPSLVISGLSLCVAIAAVLWNRHIWRMARRTDVRVMAWHNASGIDIFGADSTTVEHVIELRLYNYGEQPEYVTFTGVEAVSGELLADDRPVAPRLVDSPPPAPREVPPRGQLAVKFKVPAEAIAQGFVGFAELATGHRLFSAPEKVNTGLSALQSEITQVISEGQNERQRRH